VHLQPVTDQSKNEACEREMTFFAQNKHFFFFFVSDCSRSRIPTYFVDDTY